MAIFDNILSKILEAAPSAPPKAPPVPKKKPASPFKPQKLPKELPKPKAKRQHLREAFEDEANPDIVNFWKNIRKQPHTFAKHPIMAMYGGEFANKSYEHSMNTMLRFFPELAELPRQKALKLIPQKAAQVMIKIGVAEAPYRPQLENLAIQAVSEAWDLPTEILKGFLTNNISDPGDFDDDDFDGDDLDSEFPEHLRDQINKRITLNAMTHGAAVHNMMTIHRIVSDGLNSINPKLLNMYDQFASGSASTYWITDFVKMSQFISLADVTVGSSKVVRDDNDDFQVIARAVNFPILVQELVKGVMELLSLHGLSGVSDADAAEIYKHADKLHDEPWLIQVGPHLWRSFLKIVPSGHPIVNIVSKLAAKDPKYIHDLLSKTIESVHNNDDPVEQRQALIDMMDELEDDGFEFNENDYSDFE